MSCVSQLPELPKSLITLCGPGIYQATRDRKTKALQCYLDILEYLLPADRTIASAHLWHGDLHVANIFVDPSDPTKVVSIIDWQSTEVCPLYFHARQPQIIDYNGTPVHGLERPQPLKDLEKLNSLEKHRAETLYLQKSLCSLYNTLVHYQNPRLYSALQFQNSQQYLLLVLACNLLIDGEASYLAQIAELESTWQEFAANKDSTYPFNFSSEERAQMEANAEGAARGMEAMRSIRDSLGELCPEQGIVRLQQYDEAMGALRQIKEQVISTFATNSREKEEWEKTWPFDT